MLVTLDLQDDLLIWVIEIDQREEAILATDRDVDFGSGETRFYNELEHGTLERASRRTSGWVTASQSLPHQPYARRAASGFIVEERRELRQGSQLAPDCTVDR